MFIVILGLDFDDFGADFRFFGHLDVIVRSGDESGSMFVAFDTNEDHGSGLLVGIDRIVGYESELKEGKYTK